MKQLFLTTLIFFTLTFNAVFALDANIKDGAISYSENIKTDLSQDQITEKLEQYISNNFKGASENHKLNEETPVFSCNQWGKIDLYKSKLSSSSIYIKYRVTLKWVNNECCVIF